MIKDDNLIEKMKKIRLPAVSELSQEKRDRRFEKMRKKNIEREQKEDG